jgi:hypothetical protein
MADETAVAQPEEGQEQGGQEQSQGHPSWDLSRYPADMRDFAQQVLRDHDGDVTRRFQEHAEYKKGWEPFEQIEGLRDMDPEEVAGLVDFRNRLMSEGGEQEFINGLFDPEVEGSEDRWAEIGQQNGWLDDDDAEGDGYGDDGDEAGSARERQLEQKLEELQNIVTGRFQQEDMQRETEQLDQEIDQELNGLHDEFGEFDDEAVQALSLTFDGDDALRQGLAYYFKIRGDSQQELVGSKQNQPDPALSGGRADTEPEQYKGFNDPRLKQNAMRRFSNQGPGR